MPPKRKHQKRNLVGAGTKSTSGLFVRPDSTIPELAQFINSTTDPSEIYAVLERLKSPPVGSKLGSTNYSWLRDNRERAMALADKLEQMVRIEHDESLRVMDMFRNGDTSNLARAIGAVGDAIQAFDTVKSLTNPVGVLKTGLDTLVSTINFLKSPGFNRSSTQTSYSYKNQLKSELGQFAGPLGELGGILAGTIAEVFGAKSLAQVNDSAVRARVKAKYELSLKFIDEFRRWWDSNLASTKGQSEMIQGNLDKSRADAAERMRYEQSVHWIERLDDEQYRQKFGSPRAPGSKYLSFDEWRKQNGLVGGSISGGEVGHPLSGSEVQSWLPHAKMHTFKELAHMRSIDELLGKSKTAIVLYEIQPSIGHWTAVFERPDGVIECYDSLGYKPDDEIGFIPDDFQESSNQDHSHLLNLLAHTKKRVEYNEKKLQKDKQGISTCGRHCILRIAFKDMSIKQFQQFVKKHKIDDAVVAAIIPNKPNDIYS
jgi:hypothetical protein